MYHCLRIGIDMDGPMYSFVTDAAAVVAMYLGVDPSDLSPATTEDFFTQWGVESEQFWNLIKDAVADGRVSRWGIPVVGAVDAISDLRAKGHTIHIVTGRETYAAANTVAWLSDNEVEYDSLTFSGDKTVVATDVFLDDNTAHLDALKSAGTITARYMCPWNMQATQHPGMRDWCDFADYVETVSHPERTWTRRRGTDVELQA